MMSIEISEKDRGPVNIHKGITITLVISFVIHILSILYLQGSPGKTVQKIVKITDRTIEVTLKLKQPVKTSPENDTPKPTAPARTKATPTRAQKTPTTSLENKTDNRKDTSSLKSRIHVGKDSIRESLKEFLAADKPRSTDNGATVMDLSLLDTLQRSERITEYTQAPDQFPEDSSYEAGSWTDFVNISGKCFRVKRANPLEAMSRDTWYRTSCK